MKDLQIQAYTRSSISKSRTPTISKIKSDPTFTSACSPWCSMLQTKGPSKGNRELIGRLQLLTSSLSQQDFNHLARWNPTYQKLPEIQKIAMRTSLLTGLGSWSEVKPIPPYFYKPLWKPSNTAFSKIPSTSNLFMKKRNQHALFLQDNGLVFTSAILQDLAEKNHEIQKGGSHHWFWPMYQERESSIRSLHANFQKWIPRRCPHQHWGLHMNPKGDTWIY